MSPDPNLIRTVRASIDAADGLPPTEALEHLRAAAEGLADLIDESMAEAVVDDGTSIRSAGAAAGLTENAVGPRLARTRRLAPYADDKGRVTATGVQRARYDAETGIEPPAPGSAPPPMRFKPRRPTN